MYVCALKAATKQTNILCRYGEKIHFLAFADKILKLLLDFRLFLHKQKRLVCRDLFNKMSRQIDLLVCHLLIESK